VPSSNYFERVKDYVRCFDSPAGRAVLEDMERSYRDTFDPNPQVSAFKQGKRQVILDIQHLLRLSNDKDFTEESVKDYFTDDGEANEDGE
jgi:hypothetical protein